MDILEKKNRIHDMVNRAYGTRYMISKTSVEGILKAIENKAVTPSERFDNVVFEISKIHEAPSNKPIAARCYVTLGLRAELPAGVIV